MKEKRETDLKDALIDYFFRNHGFVFISAFLLGPMVIVWANTLTSITIYENIMLCIGWTQAVIIGYLSFKIFEVSKRDSELPNLAYKIVEVEDCGSPFENHMVVRDTVRFTNLSFGRAKITDIDINAEFDELLLERYKSPEEGNIVQGFPEGRPVPTILDKGEQVDVMFQINGFNYLDSVALEITEDVMGTQECQLLVSEISNWLAMQSSAEKESESEVSSSG